MRRIAPFALAAALLAAVLPAAAPGPAAAAGYKVIVNKENPAPGLPKGKVALMFMKSVSRWEHGATVEPVDQSAASPVRAAFTREIHGRDVDAIQSAWQRAVFAGRGEPPPELGTDEEVVAWVATHPGGIGYVSEGVPTDKVKVLTVVR